MRPPGSAEPRPPEFCTASRRGEPDRGRAGKNLTSRDLARFATETLESSHDCTLSGRDASRLPKAATRRTYSKITPNGPAIPGYQGQSPWLQEFVSVAKPGAKDPLRRGHRPRRRGLNGGGKTKPVGGLQQLTPPRGAPRHISGPNAPNDSCSRN